MYGETGAELRGELAALLRQHRVQQRLGGSSREARIQVGVLIRTYRQTVLVWLNQAMHAASPMTFTNLPPAQANPFRSVGTAGSPATTASELARALDLTTTQSHAHSASAEALASPADNPVVEHWRLAARAAALAEHQSPRRTPAG